MKLFSRPIFRGLASACILVALISSYKSRPSTANETTLHLESIFPSTPSLVIQQASSSIAQARQALEAIISIPATEKTFANTIKKFDDLIAFSNFSLTATAVHVLEAVSPDEVIRSTAHETILHMQEFAVDEISNNFDLYTAIKSYYEYCAPHENLSDKERYYVEQLMLGFKHKGFDLPEATRLQIKQLEKEISRLCLEFDTNIASDQTKIQLPRQALIGVADDFILSLPEVNGNREILINAPNYMKIMGECSSKETRQLLYTAYMNRAYPANDALLKQIIAKRHELANVTGFDSYASYDLDLQMVKTPQRAQTFLDNLSEQIQPKITEELLCLQQLSDPSVTMNPEGKFYPWDRYFVENQYKKRFLQIDEKQISEYFPLDITLTSLLSVYSQFFSLDLTVTKADNLWDDNLLLVKVYSKSTHSQLGCILLDLFPRPFKFSHACDINLIPATYVNGAPNIALSLVIANFSPPFDNKPALLERSQIRTLFHEFGHALHDMLGRTSLASTSGTSVKMDFVEMPSQMLEEWLFDKQILKKISSHYLSQEPLPDELIDRILALKNTFSGLSTMQQLYFARLSLDLFGPGAEKDPYEISKNLKATIYTQAAFSPEDHMYASFGHLSGYGAKYYGYMWSKVFALDLFSVIKQQGLLNASIGGRYANEILGEGAAVDPNILLENFLGREPNNEAFLKDLGI